PLLSAIAVLPTVSAPSTTRALSTGVVSRALTICTITNAAVVSPPTREGTARHSGRVRGVGGWPPCIGEQPAGTPTSAGIGGKAWRRDAHAPSTGQTQVIV